MVYGISRNNEGYREPNISGANLQVGWGRAGTPSGVKYIKAGSKLESRLQDKRATLHFAKWGGNSRSAHYVFRDDNLPLQSILVELYLLPSGERRFVLEKVVKIEINDPAKGHFDFTTRRVEKRIEEGEELPKEVKNLIELLKKRRHEEYAGR